MTELEKDDSTQNKLDYDAYQIRERNNSIARITLLSSMQDDIMCEFDCYTTAHEIQQVLNKELDGTFTTKLSRLTTKFDTYKKCPNKPHFNK